MTDKLPDTTTYIDSKADLNEIISELKNEDLIAFDLEADSMFHFKEKVCLIQIASQQSSYIIDPLRVPDLNPLSEILSNPSITKILHGADYDIRSLYRDFGFTIDNLFDTELASRFLGNSETGLGAVLKKRFNVILEKKYQKKDWSQRPLPDEMISYASKDVQYLIPLYTIQINELSEKGRLEWIKEECRDLTMVRPAPANERPLFTKIKGAGRLDRRTLAVLEALLEFRVNIAEQKDRPLFKIINNAAILKIAQLKPGTMRQLLEIKALSEKQANMYGNSLIRAIKNAIALDDAELPTYPYNSLPRIKKDVSDKLKKLKAWRDRKAIEYEIEPGVLINNAALKSIAESNPKNNQNLDLIPGLKKWQKKALGNEIIINLKQPEQTNARTKN